MKDRSERERERWGEGENGETEREGERWSEREMRCATVWGGGGRRDI